MEDAQFRYLYRVNRKKNHLCTLYKISLCNSDIAQAGIYRIRITTQITWFRRNCVK